MGKFYFDIETNSPGDKPNPKTDTIITAQICNLENDGEPIKILKEWKIGEEAILEELDKLFFGQAPFNFVPVGRNIAEFDFPIVYRRMKAYGIEHSFHEFYYGRPFIDIKYAMIMMNRDHGDFKDHNAFLPHGDNKQIHEWYTTEQYGRIVTYIEDECNDFIQFYQKLLNSLASLGNNSRRF